MVRNSFFDKQTDQSLVKTRIVKKYFQAWAKVIIPIVKKSSEDPKVAYIDLFAGPGRYHDGSQSTPIRILEIVIENNIPDLNNIFISIFNDTNIKYVTSLRQVINSIPGIETLKYPPTILNHEVGNDIVNIFQQYRLIPSLLFIDPWGYKGLSLQLINSVIKDWGCDCIFFFNYNRINRDLNNTFVQKHMHLLFGLERAEKLRHKLSSLDPHTREKTIITEMSEALKGIDRKYVLTFCFKYPHKNRTSHYLFFVTKHIRGHNIMKDIMANESSEYPQGVPSFEYNPSALRQPSLFDLNRPIDELEIMLLSEFAGKTITMRKLYDQHNVGKRYVEKNYKVALRNLEQKGKIVTDPPASQRPKRKGETTFADSVKIKFPAKQ